MNFKIVNIFCLSFRTQLKQEAVVTIHGIPLSSYLEKIITQNINNNAHKVRIFFFFTFKEFINPPNVLDSIFCVMKKI